MHDKISKEEAEYVSKANDHFCKNCTMIIRWPLAPNLCKLVEGKVSFDGSCRYFEPKGLPTKG